MTVDEEAKVSTTLMVRYTRLPLRLRPLCGLSSTEGFDSGVAQSYQQLRKLTSSIGVTPRLISLKTSNKPLDLTVQKLMPQFIPPFTFYVAEY